MFRPSHFFPPLLAMGAVVHTLPARSCCHERTKSESTHRRVRGLDVLLLRLAEARPLVLEKSVHADGFVLLAPNGQRSRRFPSASAGNGD